MFATWYATVSTGILLAGVAIITTQIQGLQKCVTKLSERVAGLEATVELLHEQLQDVQESRRKLRG